MEYLIFSDSHGNSRNLQEAFRLQVQRPRGIIFLGDGLRDLEATDFNGVPVMAVRGNCDWLSENGIPSLMLSLGEHTAFCVHGDAYGVKNGLDRLKAAAVCRGADLVLFGHTHQPYLEILPAGERVEDTVLQKPLYLFNPGSIGQGKASFGVLTLLGENVLFSHGSL
ncbi:MAG: YfcE family phosphodiesterase [Ruminococcaceae bacterium]|nr:YfcE family phosphodiesterase [Oscillospiraceae bacterium]